MQHSDILAAITDGRLNVRDLEVHEGPLWVILLLMALVFASLASFAVFVVMVGEVAKVTRTPRVATQTVLAFLVLAVVASATVFTGFGFADRQHHANDSRDAALKAAFPHIVMNGRDRACISDLAGNTYDSGETCDLAFVDAGTLTTFTFHRIGDHIVASAAKPEKVYRP